MLAIRRRFCWKGALAALLFFLAAALPLARGQAAPGSAAPPAETDVDGSLADLVILLDRSGSMVRNDPQDLAVTGARVLVDMLAPSDRVAVVAFDTDVRPVLPLTTLGDGAAARQALDRIGAPAGQWTDIKGGLAAAMEILAGQAGRGATAVLLFTDGKPEISPDGVPPGYREAMAELVGTMAGRKIPVFTVGLGQADFATLSEIATGSQAESFAATSPTQAVSLFADVLSRLKERHVALTFEEDLAPGAVGRARTLQVPPYTRLLTLSAVGSGPVKLRVTNPAGAPVTGASNLKSTAGGNYAVYTIADPTPGVWTVQAEGAGRLQVNGQTESALRLRLAEPAPYSRVPAKGPLAITVRADGDPDPASPLEVWAQSDGGAAVRLERRGDSFAGRLDPGTGALAVWALRAGGEVARQEFRLYPSGTLPAAAAASPATGAGRTFWPYLAGLGALLATTLAFGQWRWRRLRRREEVLQGRLGNVVLTGLGKAALLTVTPDGELKAVRQRGRAGAPGPAAGPRPAAAPGQTAAAAEPIAALQAVLTPTLPAPLAGLGLGRRRLQLYIRPAPGIRLAINGHPGGDGRLFHLDEVGLGSHTLTFLNPGQPRRPNLTVRHRFPTSGRPLDR